MLGCAEQVQIQKYKTNACKTLIMMRYLDALYAKTKPKMKCSCLKHVDGTIIFVRSVSLNVSI